MKIISIRSTPRLAPSQNVLNVSADFPRNAQIHTASDLTFAGWVLSADENSAPPRLVIEVDGTPHDIHYEIDRPDVLKAILKKTEDARLTCGYRVTLAVQDYARVYLLSDGRKLLWHEIVLSPVTTPQLFDILANPRNGFATTTMSLPVSGSDSTASISKPASLPPPTPMQSRSTSPETGPELLEARLITFKGKEITFRLSEAQTSSLPDGLLETGDLYQALFTYADGSRTLCKGCFGDKGETSRQFRVYELPRDDFSIMEPSTEELLRSGPDIINLKKLIIRLRRARRGIGHRGVFTGVAHDYIASDLASMKSLSENYFSIVNEVVDTRFVWSLVDCIADHGGEIEKACALSVSNFMHAERMAHSLKNSYELVEKDIQINNSQLHYWGGMLGNHYTLDDSLDVFLTRASDVLCLNPIIQGYFYSIMLKASENNNSLLGENLKRSAYFREAFAFYTKLFSAHIASLDRKTYPDFGLAA